MCFNLVNAQETTDGSEASLIEWKQHKSLNWRDYKFRSLKNRRIKSEVAITTIRISARGYLTKGIPDFTVKTLFVKEESWTSDSTDVNLLRHEQLHFDIGELYAQKIRVKINELKAAGKTSPKEYRAEIKNLITIFKSYSGQYDRETAHGTDRERQSVWQERIRGLLQNNK